MDNPSLEALIEEFGIKTVSEEDIQRELNSLIPKFDEKHGLKTAAEIDQAIREGKVPCPCCDALVENWIDWTALLSTQHL